MAGERGFESAGRSAVTGILEDAVRRGVTPGAVWGVADVHGIVGVGAVGSVASQDADGNSLRTRTPATPEVLYDLASVTKVYTAVTVLGLAGRGVLALDAPIGRWLPEYRVAGKSAVTLAHLLSHTAGLPATWDGWRSQVAAAGSRTARWRERAREEVLADILAVDLARAPGQDFEYSCLGYITAMAVAERATGCAWDTLVTEQLLRPLGLRQTMFRPVGRCTAPTERQPELGRPLVHGVVHDETAYALSGVSGNAGLFAPVRDVLRLGHALLEGATEVLSAEMADRLWEDQLPELLGPAGAARGRQREGFGHSLGLRIGQTSFMGRGAAAVRGHTGFTGTSLLADRERGAAVVLLTNRVHPRRDGPDLAPVRAAVADALRPERAGE